MAMFLLLQQQQQAMQQAIQEQTRQLAASLSTRRITAPTISWPQWDGSTSGIPAFVEQLKTLQQDPFFKGADWTQKLPGFDEQSNWLRANILQHLPAAELHRFMNRSDFESDGFAMFAHLMDRLQPNTVQHLMLDVIALGNLEHRPGEPVEEYISRGRRLFNSLSQVTVAQLLPLLLLCLPWNSPQS